MEVDIDNMSLDDALVEFKKYKINITGVSESSVKYYIIRANKFFKYFDIKKVGDIKKIKIENIREWLIYLAEEEKLHPRNRNNILMAVKIFYSFLIRGMNVNLEEDIFKIPSAKVPYREPKFIEYEDFLDYANYVQNPLIKAGVVMMFCTGVRFCELLQITCKDIERGYADIIGKRDKERRIWFNEWVKETANEYIRGRRKKTVETYGLEDNDFLFLSKKGRLIYRKSFEDEMKTWAKKFNEDPLYKGRLEWWNEFSPHKLRHSFGTNQLKNGYDIATVRDELGHASIITTNTYSHSTKERVKLAMLGQLNNNGEKTKTEIEMEKLVDVLSKDEKLRRKVKAMIGGI